MKFPFDSPIFIPVSASQKLIPNQFVSFKPYTEVHLIVATQYHGVSKSLVYVWVIFVSCSEYTVASTITFTEAKLAIFGTDQ